MTTRQVSACALRCRRHPKSVDLRCSLAPPHSCPAWCTGSISADRPMGEWPSTVSDPDRSRHQHLGAVVALVIVTLICPACSPTATVRTAGSRTAVVTRCTTAVDHRTSQRVIRATPCWDGCSIDKCPAYHGATSSRPTTVTKSISARTTPRRRTQGRRTERGGGQDAPARREERVRPRRGHRLARGEIE